MPDQSNHKADLERIGVSLSTGVHVAHELWPVVGEDERVRTVALSACSVLLALINGLSREAAEGLRQMDNARSLI